MRVVPLASDLQKLVNAHCQNLIWVYALGQFLYFNVPSPPPIVVFQIYFWLNAHLHYRCKENAQGHCPISPLLYTTAPSYPPIFVWLNSNGLCLHRQTMQGSRRVRLLYGISYLLMAKSQFVELFYRDSYPTNKQRASFHCPLPMLIHGCLFTILRSGPPSATWCIIARGQTTWIAGYFILSKQGRKLGHVADFFFFF